MYVLGVGCVFMLVFASSRGGWIGGVVGFVTLLFLLSRKVRARTALTFALVAFLAISLVAILTRGDLYGYVWERTADLVALTEGRVEDDSAKHRLGVLMQLWDAFQLSPVVGLGPGGAGRIAEGQYIRELVEGGVVGATIALSTLFLVLRSGVRCLRYGATPTVRGIGLGFVGGTMGLLAQSLFTELFVVVKLAVPFWLLSALVQRLSIDATVAATADGPRA